MSSTHQTLSHRCVLEFSELPRAYKPACGTPLTLAEIAKVFKLWVFTNWTTQKEAAAALGVGEQYLSRVASGTKAPSSDMLEKIGYESRRLYVPVRPNYFRLPQEETPKSVIGILEELEQQGMKVIGFYNNAEDQAIISVTHTPEVEKLGGNVMFTTETQDRTHKESFWVAHFKGAIVRWSVIEQTEEKTGGQ